MIMQHGLGGRLLHGYMAAEEQHYILKWDFQRKQTDGGLPISTLDVAQKL